MSTRRATTLARTRRAGFTLIELMVSLTVGGIAISSIYAVGAASTRVFHQQQQVANAQTTLRMALNQLKRDIARAGYLSTPGAGLPGQVCGTVDSTLHVATSNALAGISRFENNRALNATNLNINVAPGADTVNEASGFTVDDVVLIANYETASEYSGVTMVSANTVAVGGASHAFRRDFTNWYDPVPALATDSVAFRRAFTVDRLIRLRLSTNLSHFSRITAVTIPAAGSPNDITVQFAHPLPTDCQAAAAGSWIAPVSAIRYTVQNAAANSLDLERFEGSTGPMAQLLRQEVLPTDKATPLGANTRAILDYVVGFNLSFTMNGATDPNARDEYTPGILTNTTAAPAPLTVNTNPERIRSVVIDLAVRTPEQDPTFQWDAVACANQRCYRAFSDRPGAARVRRARAEVFVPNIASEGY